MFDQELFSTLLKMKLKVLLATLGISFLIILIVMISFVAYGSPAFEQILAFSLALALQAITVGLFIFVIIIAYMDYYTHFPLAIYMGKTRKQFLFVSLVTSALILTLGMILAFLGIQLLPLASAPLKESINLAFNPAQYFQAGLSSLKGFAYLYGYLMVALYLLAVLNYRFGAKVWLFLLGISTFISIMSLLPFAKNLLHLFRFFDIDYWRQLLEGEARIHLLASGELMLSFVTTILITLRLTPIQKIES